MQERPPVVVGLRPIHQDRALFAAMAGEVALPVTVEGLSRRTITGPDTGLFQMPV